MKALGLDHKLSHDIAWGIRSLSIELFNQYNMVAAVTSLTKLIQELFAELPAVVERLDEDEELISEIIQDRKIAELRKSEEAKEITYETDLGLLFKDKLRISSNGVEYKNNRISLEQISWVRWGAVRKSVNGFPAGTEYTFAMGGSDVVTILVKTGKREVYEAFTNCLWKAVCVRLLQQYLEVLKAGKQVSIGGVAFDDNGIYLTKHKIFGSEIIYNAWGEVSYYSANGSLIIINKADKKTYVELSFLSVWNVHILEVIIRLSFESWKGRLSGLLGD